MNSKAEHRINYVKKAIKDYEEFLAKSHPPEFYTFVIKFRSDLKFERTNEEHIIWLINYYKDELKQLQGL